MPEQLLHAAQVGPRVEHVGGEGVPEDVRRDALEGRDAQHVCIDDAGHAAAVAQGVCRVFRRVKAGQTPGYPRFKGTARFDSVEWPKDGDGARFWLFRAGLYRGLCELKASIERCT